MYCVLSLIRTIDDLRQNNVLFYFLRLKYLAYLWLFFSDWRSYIVTLFVAPVAVAAVLRHDQVIIDDTN